MGLQVPFAPYRLVFFFRYCNYLFRETQTKKVDKTTTNPIRFIFCYQKCAAGWHTI